MTCVLYFLYYTGNKIANKINKERKNSYFQV